MAARKASLLGMARNLLIATIICASTFGAAAVRGQVLAPVGNVVGGISRLPGEVTEGVAEPIGRAARQAGRLAEQRLARLRRLATRNPQAIELDDAGEPAVRGEVLVIDPSDDVLRRTNAAGFTTLSDERIEGVGVRTIRLRPPEGWSLEEALKRLRRIAPQGDFAANHLHFAGGAVSDGAGGARLASGSAPRAPLGLIDGGVAPHPTLGGPIEQRGFAAGAPSPSSHGTAVASLIAGKGAVRGAAPGAALLVADVFGRDPTGGNAVSIARALGWMVQRGVPVVTMSLVGPPNSLLARTVTAVRARGLLIVAAVGNDGPAAPPSYPASYPGVIAVTGVDGRDRALIEAGRALHLDYAAPGADMLAAASGGTVTPVRGTSFAAPFVAGRLALLYRAPNVARRASALDALDREARDLGRRGPDAVFGRGLVCGDCRTRMR